MELLFALAFLLGGGLLPPPSLRLPAVLVSAEDGGGDDGDDYNYYNYYSYGDDAAAADDAAVADDDDYADGGGNGDDGSGGDDDSSASVPAWAEYAVFPRRCLTYDGADMIMFSVYENAYRQCTDVPMETYVVPVSTYVSAYLNQEEADAYEAGSDDYQSPDSAQYVDCVEINDGVYVRLGCAEGDARALSANVYSDYECTVRDESYGDEVAKIDVSDLEIPMKQCQACVAWMDRNDGQVDDQYYANEQINAPLCSTLWSYKEICDKSCQRQGRERLNIRQQGWDTSDKVLLAILSLFGTGMLIGIIKRRRTMSNKETLLEQAAMTAAGLQQSHIVGIFILIVIIIVVFALLGLKTITWALLLLTNAILFVYLMKLTVDSGVNSPVVGSDGAIPGTQVNGDYREASDNPLPPVT